MLEKILKDLYSKDTARRTAAIARARTLPPDTLLELILADNKNLNRRRAKSWIAALLLLAVMTPLSVRLAPILAESHWLGAWIAVMFGVPFPILCSISLRGRQSLASILANTEDATLLPHLLSMLAIDGYDGGIPLSTVLLRLLPKFSRQQAVLLTPKQRLVLLRPLLEMREAQYRNNRMYSELFQATLCVLKCLEQIGDGAEYELVRQLASIKVRTEKDRQLQQAAQECLPFLEICVQKQKQAQTLLRPSDNKSTTTRDTLLRPAAANQSETPPDQLLRPL